MCSKDAFGMAKSVEPDQTAPLGVVLSGSTLFVQPVYSKPWNHYRYIKSFGVVFQV